MMDAQAHNASERHAHIEHTPTHLLNQQPLDRANLVIVTVEHSRPFDAITLNDRLGRTGLIGWAPEIVAIVQDAAGHHRAAHVMGPLLIRTDLLDGGPRSRLGG